MNFLDIIIGSILLYGLVRGIWRGLFVEFASLVSLLLGILIAVKFSGFTADLIREKFSDDFAYIEITAFAITFILVVVGIILLAKVFTKIADFAALGWINRLLGGIFGLLKMVFILSIVLHFFGKINQNGGIVTEEQLNESLLYNPVKQTSEVIYPILSEWFDKAKEEIEIQPSETPESEE